MQYTIRKLYYGKKNIKRSVRKSNALNMTLTDRYSAGVLDMGKKVNASALVQAQKKGKL